MLTNLDDITHNTLKFFFNSNLSPHAELSRSGKAINMFILDYDRGLKPELMNELISNNQYAIVLYREPKKIKNNERIIWLTKPIQASLLKENIGIVFKNFYKVEDATISIAKVNPINRKSPNNITEKQYASNSHLYSAVNKETDNDKINRYRAHKHVGANKDIDPNNPSDLKKIYLTPNKYLYYHISRAIKMAAPNKSDIKIKTLFGTILYNRKNQELHHAFDENKMKFMQTCPLFHETDLSFIDIEPALMRSKPVTVDVRQMLWESSIMASKGRIPNNTKLDSIIEMKHWPNFSKLKLFRYAIQISAAWSKHKLSLIDTANQLKIPQRYVFTLYCAMNAIDCVNISSINKSEKITFKSKNQSLFSKILSHMFR